MVASKATSLPVAATTTTIVASAVAVAVATAATIRKGEQTPPQTCTEMVTDPPH